MKARVIVMLKSSVLDPQGRAVLGGLQSLGYSAVRDVRVGKEIILTLEGMSREEADRQVRDMCQKLLANPVIEDFSYTLEQAS